VQHGLGEISPHARGFRVIDAPAVSIERVAHGATSYARADRTRYISWVAS